MTAGELAQLGAARLTTAIWPVMDVWAIYHFILGECGGESR